MFVQILLLDTNVKWWPTTVMSHEGDGVWNWRTIDCLFSRLFGLTSKKTSKPALLALCEGNPPVIGGFPSQRDSNTGNICMSWRENAVLVFPVQYIAEIKELHPHCIRFVQPWNGMSSFWRHFRHWLTSKWWRFYFSMRIKKSVSPKLHNNIPTVVNCCEVLLSPLCWGSYSGCGGWLSR